ncbi:hypothetical protein E0L35_03655 [Halomonas sp. ATBC28]|jgi:hypothetical protein|uniref:Uncharacterized protein n=1 Tax=Vreelandella titanicae TaxID=664683 RepID=A0A6N0Z433_9GAMM|nr:MULTISPECIES: hypothetical protein [Halomonas]NAO98171.1 hypothetical protein [Halomonas sp. MG34]QGQ71073.1 hypothetical protein FDY98_15925 [Halomonas sp. PA16-9]KIN17037.1 hypothetical protein RO22_01645 [Halomonas sp. KHS3]MCD1585860.1 hypothetical protein [Halomonas sp. IOP_14]MCE7517860.1 hypothetical protein [Halomonas titanicae]|tara:strand:+ start:1872 stop:2174 length:303 start_codon:yes stop_codon:yes gene_type:complete
MFNDFVKKAAVVGLSFGLLASPLAFAHMSIEANQDLTVDDEPIQAQSHHTSGQAKFSPSDLMYDEGDRPRVIKAESHHTSAQAEYTAKDLTQDVGDGNVW